MTRTVITLHGTVEYEVTKKSIKKMYLRVKEDGRVLVSVPQRVGMGEADLFVQRNSRFVSESLERLQERGAKRQHSYETGDTFYLLGQTITLDVRIGAGTKGTLSPEGVLTVTVPEPDLVEEQVNQFFFDQCQEYFPPLLAEYQEKYRPLQIPESGLKIRTMKSQWGSCNRRNNVITLNTRLIHLPYPCVEYVVIHEFAHYIHGNHSQDFYQVVAQFCPAWKERRQEMKQWGELV